MKIKAIAKGALSLLLCLILLCSVIPLSACTQYGGTDTPPEKDVLYASVESEEADSLDAISDYFDKWDFPTFSKTKINAVELTLRHYFIKELPSPYEMAKAAAKIFLDEFFDTLSDSGAFDKEKVTDALSSSIVSSMGDDYSFYRTKEEFDDYSSNMSGSFVGIGVTVAKLDTGAGIVSVIEGSGAEEAGLLAGDVIVSVSGERISDIGYDAALDLIGGEEGSTVVIGVCRGGEEKSFTVVRKRVTENTVRYEINSDKIALITISSFKANTADLFKEAVDSAVRDGARGIIYDVRANPGGYLSAVCDSLAYVSKKGTTLASFSNNYGDPIKDGDSHELSLPTVVIANGQTASAGELFTAAMRDFSDMGYFDVTLVGEATFGKGIMQSTYGFADGSTVTMTVAYYNPPSGENYHGSGVLPDVSVSESPDGDAQLERAYIEIEKLIK